MHFQNAIFAGGGSRCLWQVGFWDGANEAGLGLDTSVNYAASTSAGCAMALVVLLGRGPEALALFKKLTAANPANIHWQNLKPGSGKPLFPHLRIYRQALEEFLMPDDLKNLEGKQLEFLMARFPRYMPSSWRAYSGETAPSETPVAYPPDSSGHRALGILPVPDDKCADGETVATVSPSAHLSSGTGRIPNAR